MNIEFMSMIDQELDNAKAKHPDFCDRITTLSTNESSVLLARIRAYNEMNNDDTATMVLEEEIYEFIEAYLEKDYDHAIQELAQCGAVILRMIKFVKKEKEAKR